ncbi:MAG: (deoxy)nucleoside triphosphate pyrophosphohydrolase [Hyphomonadaceae bacterium]
MTVLLVVAAALFDDEGRVLLAQRPEGKSMAGLWEFPGGKIETDETPEEALIRELYEELGVVITCENLKPMKFASHAYEDFHLLMPLYACYRWAGVLESKEGQSLKWVERHRLHDFPAPAADIPLFDYLVGCQEVEVP